MKNKKNIIVLSLVSLLVSTSSCSQNNDSDLLYYKEKAKIISSFDGLGVEWGIYEDTGKLVPNAWERVIESVDRLNPKMIRCMTNLEWVVKNFDSKGNDDISDDTWEYDFNNKYMDNACDILDYCQNNNIKVAFGIWNVIGQADESDDYHMIRNVSSDPRWATMSADLMEYLIKIKGYTCIKYFVNTNEPNYTGAYGTSKNAYNTYEIWEKGVKNVRAAFDNIGLQSLDIVGGDTTGFAGSADYLPKIATNLSSHVNNYGVHMYISNYDIDNCIFQKNLTTLYNKIQELDSSLGNKKNLYIWESGLLDGKNSTTDCNAYIANFSYGMRMADYTLQSIQAGVNGIVYWDLDDAQHFMYTESGITAKEWGMFSTLNDASAFKQAYRPWYHSSTLLTNLLSVGSRIYTTSEETIRNIGVVDKDGQNGGFVLINRGMKEITKTLQMEETIANSSQEIYVYVFNENELRLDENGFVTENYIIKGSLNNKTTINIPANSMVVLSTRRL